MVVGVPCAFKHFNLLVLIPVGSVHLVHKIMLID